MTWAEHVADRRIGEDFEMTELAAMGAIDDALAGLEDDAARLRAIEWAISKWVAPANERLQTMHREAEALANDATTAYTNMLTAFAEVAQKLSMPYPKVHALVERLAKEAEAETEDAAKGEK